MLNYLFKQKLVILCFAFWALFLGVMPNLSQASLVDSKKGYESEPNVDLEKVKLFLDKEIVAKKLSRMGVDRPELLKRVEKLDKEQLHELAMRCDKIKVGGSAGGIFLVILIIGLIIVTVLYFTNYTIKVQPRDAIPRRY